MMITCRRRQSPSEVDVVLLPRCEWDVVEVQLCQMATDYLSLLNLNVT